MLDHELGCNCPLLRDVNRVAVTLGRQRPHQLSLHQVLTVAQAELGTHPEHLEVGVHWGVKVTMTVLQMHHGPGLKGPAADPGQ